MRTWTRNVYKRACGCCGHVVDIGEPILRLTFPDSAAVLWRCVECEGPAPDDLPSLPVAPERPAMIARIQQLLTSTARDWKRSAGNDE